MATAGVSHIYEEDDLVDEYLLNLLSKWILYDRLPSLARDLGISKDEFIWITNTMNQPEEQIFKVNFIINLSSTFDVLISLF